MALAALSITCADAGVRPRTLDVVERLVSVAADTGARVLAQGPSARRRLRGLKQDAEA